MADTSSTGTPAANTPTFNLASAMHLLHGVAYRRKAITSLAVQDYHQVSDAFESIQTAALLCQRTSNGLDLLLDLLDGSNIDRYVVDSMRGLLGPMAAELNRTSAVLQSTITN